MEEWKQDKLIDLLDSLIDYRGKTPRKVDKGIPLITAKIVKNGRIDMPTEFIDIKDYNSWMVRGFPKNGDVILTTEAPLGEVAQLDDKKIALAQRIVCLRGKEGVLDNTFLKYFLLSSLGQARLKARETGTTVTGIKQSELKEVLIDYPPYKYQKQITSILKSLDDKIELNRRINENLEQQAQALFKSWFIDNKNNKLQYYELGNITLITAGGDKPSVYSKDLTEQCRIPIYSNGTENEGLYGYTTSAKINSASITISARGTIGYVCLRTEPYVPIVRLISVVPNIENLSAEYLYLWALTQNINGTGTTQQQLTVPNFRHTLIGIPTKEKMIRFNNIVSPIFQRIVINKNENRILSQLRDTLLPRLMSGELEIEDNSYD